MKLKSCPKCRYWKPAFGYESSVAQFFVRCPACGFTGLAAYERAVAGVLWQTADAPDQQGKLTIPL
jgi:ssDNA-binding Zn-finger/Zn-ribbon topoisomerase 1